MEAELYFISDIEKIINRNRQTIRRWYERGIFPVPVLIESNRLAWRASTVHDWINEKFGKDDRRNLFDEIKTGIDEINESEYLPFNIEDYK